MKLLIGTAGLIDSDKIDCAEVEFTYGVRINKQKAKLIRKLSERNNLELSVHAPYYINLNSNDPIKVKASMKRIVDSAVAANMLGTKKVVFHPGFYMGKNSKDVYNMIRDRIVDILNVLDDNDIDADLLPETTGKLSQFGSLSELIKLNDELGLKFCLDFSHVHARSLGTMNYKEIVSQVDGFKELHGHYSGIQFGQRGEIRHLVVDKNESHGLISALLNSRMKKLSLICESPDTYNDALMMLKQKTSLLNNR